MEGQTLFLYGFNVVRFNHLARIVLDSQFSAVQVSDCEVNTCESLQQSDFFFDKQISSFTFKNFVSGTIQLNISSQLKYRTSFVLPATMPYWIHQFLIER